MIILKFKLNNPGIFVYFSKDVIENFVKKTNIKAFELKMLN